MENRFTVYDDNGYEKEMQILFTFETDAGVNYVIYHDIDDNNEYFAGKYNDEGELFPELTQEEWDMCYEMLNTFMEEIEKETQE